MCSASLRTTLYPNGVKIELPVGTHEVQDIADKIQKYASASNKTYYFKVKTTNNILQTTIKNNFPIDLTKPNSVG